MKKLLMTAVAVIGLIGQAQAAPTVPKEILGQWCLVKEDKNRTSYYASRGAREQCSKDVLVIKTDRYEGTEHVCRNTKVKTDGSTSQIDSKCDGEGWEWSERTTIYLSKGRLVVKTYHTSQERR